MRWPLTDHATPYGCYHLNKSHLMTWYCRSWQTSLSSWFSIRVIPSWLEKSGIINETTSIVWKKPVFELITFCWQHSKSFFGEFEVWTVWIHFSHSLSFGEAGAKPVTNNDWRWGRTSVFNPCIVLTIKQLGFELSPVDGTSKRFCFLVCHL